MSGTAHAAVLAAGLFAFASQKLPDAEEGIPVEVVTDNQLSEITRGETRAKQVQPQPKPRVDRVAERPEERDPGEAKKDVPAPPTRPPEMKVADTPVEVSAPPPPPPLRPQLPEPAKAPPPQAEAKPEPKPPSPPKREELAKLVEREEAEFQAKEEAKAKAESEARAKAAKAKAEAEAKAEEAKAQAEAEAQAKAEAERQKRVAEQKAKQLAEAKAKADTEAKAKKQAELAAKYDPGGIANLLKSKEPAQASGSAGAEVQRTASLGTATGAAQRLNPSQRDALMGLLRDQLHRCWQAPMSAQGAPNPPVPTVHVRLNQDGSLAATPAVVNSSSDPLFSAIAESATRATRRCAPLRIPAQFAPYYQDWKELKVNFDPRDLG